MMQLALGYFRVLVVALLLLQLMPVFLPETAQFLGVRDGRLILPFLLCLTFLLGAHLARKREAEDRLQALLWLTMATTCIFLSWYVQ
jgi:hypothetical protein